MTETVSFGNDFGEKVREIITLLHESTFPRDAPFSTFSENRPDTDSYPLHLWPLSPGLTASFMAKQGSKTDETKSIMD
ncbi:hypothetical protein [Lelliottia sp. JS-SCA-14]|uniref:hypothetical protein n=1 Tax=Lelliottia sp. JS-SCA-14 TaxID=3110110 RepID=UPI002D7A0A39|nr:hypothetical protein [Lelliottia sp. JS-SCA-14]